MPVVIKGAIRADLPALFHSRGYTKGAEIGVYRGEYSETLCQGIPGLELLCVDPWMPYINERTGKKTFFSAKPAYDIAKERLATFNCHLMRKTSAEAAKEIPDKSLDFVYIDANHWFEYVVMDMMLWTPKIRSGGILAGHDYTERLEEDNCVYVAVKGWAYSHNIVPWYVLGRPKTRRSEPKDPIRSWMWEIR
jgi:hypothetical protein